MKSGRLADNVFIHIAVWSVVIGLPLFFMNRENVSWMNFLMYLPVPLSFMMVFYVNYIYLVDKFLFRGKKGEFILINIVLILGMALLIHLWHEFSDGMMPAIENLPLKDGAGGGIMPPPQRGPMRPHHIKPIVSFIVRDVISLSIVVALSVAFKISLRWLKIEAEQKEMQQTMMEAELKNLKNQLNPHFLLNTLNNIYALAQFNSPKLQPAILDLSRLLQYVLYENNQPYVPLKEEVDFIRNYIDLMRLRLSENVKLSVNVSLLDNSPARIAPLIFISLIENAFKHGVSGGEPAFIDISLTETDDGKVKFLCQNSFFPKGESDRSGSGIGLQQVQKRLELLYPSRYVWQNDIKDDAYSVALTIDTREPVKNKMK